MQPPKISSSFLKATGLEPALIEEILSKYNADPNILQLLNTFNEFIEKNVLDTTTVTETNSNKHLIDSKLPGNSSLKKLQNSFESKDLLFLIQNQVEEIDFCKKIIKEREQENFILSNFVTAADSKCLKLQLEINSLKGEIKKAEANQRQASSQNEFLKTQLKELNFISESFKKDKSFEIESLREENKKIKHDLSITLSLKKDLSTKNKSLQKKIQELEANKNLASQALEKSIGSLQKELSFQKEQASNFESLATKAELHSKKLQDSIDRLKKDYQYMCSSVEEFEEKTQFQYSQLMNEIEFLKFENNQLKIKDSSEIQNHPSS